MTTITDIEALDTKPSAFHGWAVVWKDGYPQAATARYRRSDAIDAFLKGIGYRWTWRQARRKFGVRVARVVMHEEFYREQAEADLAAAREALRDIADGAWNVRHGGGNLTAHQFAKQALARYQPGGAT